MKRCCTVVKLYFDGWWKWTKSKWNVDGAMYGTMWKVSINAENVNDNAELTEHDFSNWCEQRKIVELWNYVRL